MNSTQFRAWLEAHGACEPALSSLGEMDMRTAWHSCQHADWLLWWLRQAGYPQDKAAALDDALDAAAGGAVDATAAAALDAARAAARAAAKAAAVVAAVDAAMEAAARAAAVAAARAAAVAAQCDIIREMVPWQDVEQLMQVAVNCLTHTHTPTHTHKGK